MEISYRWYEFQNPISSHHHTAIQLYLQNLGSSGLQPCQVQFRHKQSDATVHGTKQFNDNYQFNEHPVGNAMPASNPFSDINLRTVFSNVSHSSVIGIPGFMMPFIYFLTCRYVNLDEWVGILCTVLAITLVYTNPHQSKPFTHYFKTYNTYTHILLVIITMYNHYPHLKLKKLCLIAEISLSKKLCSTYTVHATK